jgi:hypothetical protein
MDVKEALDKIKKLVFNAEPVIPPAPVALATDYTLADGTVVSIDKLEAGGIVTIAGVVAPDGDLTLEDGTIITILSGVISVVTPKTVEPVIPEEQQMSTPEQFQEALQKFADGATPDMQGLVVIVKALFENVFGWQIKEQKDKQIRDAAIATYQAGFTAHQQALKELVPLVEKFSETVIATPVQEEKSFEDMSPVERYKFQKEQFKN